MSLSFSALTSLKVYNFVDQKKSYINLEDQLSVLYITCEKGHDLTSVFHKGPRTVLENLDNWWEKKKAIYEVGRLRH